MTVYLNYNGKIIEANQPFLTAGNRGFRFGDGLFETMRLANGQVMLADYHFERLLEGMELMDFELPAHFTASFFLEHIIALCKKNGHAKNARVRLTVFRNSGELFDATPGFPQYIIEAFPLSPTDGLNKNGLVLGLYKDACKAFGKFSAVKSNNYLLYAMAARHAKKQRWNDCLILNSKGNVCESAIANLFLIKEGVISTPGLEEGCVAGVMRRFLLEKLPELGYTIKKQTITLPMVQEANEVFLTNAIREIQWVQSFDNISYTNKEINRMHSLLHRYQTSI